MVSCIFTHKRAEGKCCVVGSRQALAENDFLGQVLRTDQEANNEMTTVGSEEDRGGSRATSDCTNEHIHHRQHKPSEESHNSITKVVVEVEMHRNGSTVHTGN